MNHAGYGTLSGSTRTWGAALSHQGDVMPTTRPDVHIRSAEDDEPGRYRVEVDGHDVSNLVTTAHIDIDARSLPEITLELIPRQVAVTLTGAAVRLDPETLALLEALGWTPPREETP